MVFSRKMDWAFKGMGGISKGGLIIVLTALLINIALVKGQELKWSAPFPWASEDFHAKQIKPVAGGYLLLAQDPNQKKRYALAFLNEKLGEPQIQTLEAPKNSRFVKMAVFTNSAQLFFYQQAKDSTYLLHQRYQPRADSLQPIDRLNAIAGSNLKAHLATSSDSTVHGIWVAPKAEALSLFRLNKQAEVTRFKTIAPSKAPKIPQVQALMAVGNTVAFLGKLPESKNFQYYRLDSSLNFHTQLLKNDSLAVKAGFLRYDRVNDQFLVLGLYKRESSDDAYAGLTYFRETDGKRYLRYQPFSRDLIKRVFGQNTMKKGLANFKLRYVIPRSDGGAMVFMESYERDRRVYHDQSYFGTINERSRQYHYYEEVLIAAVDPSGHIQWSKVHRKKQTTVNDDGRFSSYSHMVMKKRLLFLYNSISNRTMNLLAYTVTPAGKVKGELLLKDRYDQLKPIPRKATQVGPASLMLPILKDDRFYLVKVDFSR